METVVTLFIVGILNCLAVCLLLNKLQRRLRHIHQDIKLVLGILMGAHEGPPRQAVKIITEAGEMRDKKV